MKAKFNSKHIFAALYCVGLLGAAIIGLLSQSFFAYDAFNSLWSSILYLVFISLLFITAYIQELVDLPKVNNVVKCSFIYMGCLISFILLFCLSGLFTLITVFYSAAMLLLILFDAVIKARKSKEIKFPTKQFVCVFGLFIFTMAQMLAVKFVNELYMLWALIPTAIIFCIVVTAVLILLRKQLKNMFDTKLKAVSQIVLSCICAFAVAFMYSFTAVGIANCVFDFSEPTEIECTVSEKHVTSGAKTVTQFEIRVAVGDKEEWLSVPAADYYEISEQDTVVIDYYSGALGFAYIVYQGKSS